MKQVILICSVLLLCSSVSAQHSVKRFYKKYKKSESVTSISVQGWMIKPVLAFVDDFEGKEIVKKVKNLRVLSMEDGNFVSTKDFNKLIRPIVRAKNE